MLAGVLGSWKAGRVNCRGYYSTSFVIRGVGMGQWLAGLVGSARLGFVQRQAYLLYGGIVWINVRR